MSSDLLPALARQDAHLQQELQDLLDAQSEGLLAGLGGDGLDSPLSSPRMHTPARSTSSMSSTTRLTPSPGNRSTMRYNERPRREGPSLHRARRDLARKVQELAIVKSQEAHALQDEISFRAEGIDTIDRMSNKSQQLKSKIEDIEVAEASSEGASAEIVRMKATERSLDADIHAHEQRLSEMRSQQRHLLRAISVEENTLSSRMSSYREALRLAEQEERDWLARPPVFLGGNTTTQPELFWQSPKPTSADKSNVKATSVSVWTLPQQRRTLDMARDELKHDQDKLEEQRDAVIEEGNALTKGAQAWQQVFEEINAVERKLRSATRGLTKSSASQGQENGEEAETDGMTGVTQLIEHAITQISKHLQHAQEEKWNLLICCIGAELEALKQGLTMLQDAKSATVATKTSNSPPRGAPGSKTSKATRRTSLGNEKHAEDEGNVDEPGPDLMFSQEQEPEDSG